MKKQTIIWGFLIGSLALQCIPFMAKANFGAVPPKEKAIEYVYEGKAGETIKDFVQVINMDDTEISLHIYGADGGSNSQGDFYAKTKFDEQFNIGKWTKMQKNDTTLQGMGKEQIDFEINIPEITPPGTYVGAIAVENVPAQKVTGTLGLNSITRIILPVKISIPGEKKHIFSLEDFSEKLEGENTERFFLTVANKGNTAIIVEGNITVTDLKNPDPNDPDNIIPIEPIKLFQGEPIRLALEWGKRPAIGDYKAELNLTYWELDILNGEKQNPQLVVKEINFSIFPWKIIKNALLGLIIIIFMAIIYAVLKFIERKNTKPYMVEENETVEVIAKKTNVSWKKIVQINKLKPPYSLKKDQTILIPKK